MEQALETSLSAAGMEWCGFGKQMKEQFDVDQMD